MAKTPEAGGGPGGDPNNSGSPRSIDHEAFEQYINSSFAAPLIIALVSLLIVTVFSGLDHLGTP